MSITLISLSSKRIINDCIEKIVPQLKDFSNKKNNIKEEEDEDEEDINIIKTNKDKEKDEEEEEEKEKEEEEEEEKEAEQNEGEENEEDEKLKKLIIKKKKLKKNKKKIESALLIIDKETSKILSSFLSLSDLLNTGLFSIENISRVRRPFPKSSAIYMIYPTKENCEIIINDFKKISKPLYNKINIYFMESIEENILDILVNENIINRIKRCYDLNLSYYIYDKNIFTFGYNIGTNLHLLKCPKIYREKKALEISSKLFTVCSVLNIFPNIAFQLNSFFCQYIANEVNKRLKNLYKKKKFKKRGILLLTDRTVDPIIPALHDYSYCSLVYDLLENNIKPDKNKKNIFNNISISNSNAKLDYNDPLWNCYKDLNFVEALRKIPEDFNEFKSSNIGKIGVENMRNSKNMEFQLKNISAYQIQNKLFDLHIAIASEINDNFKSRFYKEIIELEQDVLLGEDKNGNNLTFEELHQRYINIKEEMKIIRPNKDIIRLLMTYLYSYEINENEFNEMINDLNENEKKIFTGLNLLNLKFSKNPDNMNHKRNKLEANFNKEELKKKNYNVIRAKSKILSIIEDCTRNNLNEFEFTYLENPENIKYRSKTIKKKRFNQFEEISKDAINDIDNLKDINKEDLSQLLIYFNIGGLSINEITSIRNSFKTNELGFKIILGSTGIYSANQYLKELINMVDNEDNEDIIDINEDEDQKDDDNDDEEKIKIKMPKNDINIKISTKIEDVKDEEDKGDIIELEIKREKENKKDKNKKEEKKQKKEKDKKGKDKKKDKKDKKKEKEKEKEKKKKKEIKLKKIKNYNDNAEENEEEED